MKVSQITSLNNDRVRRVQALMRSTRRRLHEGLFAIEGRRLVQEALDAGLPLVEVFFTADFAADPAGQALVEAVCERSGSCWEVPASVFAVLADTETPQGVLAVLPLPDLPLPPDDASGLVLIPDGVRDPGNLGTILRAAWAAGVAQVWLPPGTADVTNPKVVRAGMGAHFHVPMRRATWDELQEGLAGFSVWLAEAGHGVAYDAVDWRGRMALIVGGEATGPGAAARALNGAHGVYIPMAAGVDSLNVAVATAVLLFEAARQRR
ncbi:MAG: RNA methyltransferase [Anaerolineae bacterium]|nr:RNA methyltransferase [Anaerolineae bacterium]